MALTTKFQNFVDSSTRWTRGEPTDAPHIDEGYRKFTTLFIALSIFYQVSCKWEGIGTQLSSQGKSDHCIQKEQMPLHSW